MIGAATPRYNDATRTVARSSSLPMTMRSGRRKSCTAEAFAKELGVRDDRDVRPMDDLLDDSRRADGHR